MRRAVSALPRAGKRWAVVLAAGEGRRMEPFIRRWLGRPKPKQYCSFAGGRTMLEHTLARAVAAAGASRVVTVVDAGHREFLPESRRAELPGCLIEQPRSRDTGPGVLLPLSRVTARDPDALVVVMPSDHFIHPQEEFLARIDEAYRLAESLPGRLVLLAARPDDAEIDYGWILPGPRLPGTRAMSVSCFREKPARAQAEELRLRGGLWNTMIVAARASTLWDVARRVRPAMTARFDAVVRGMGMPDQERTLAEAYEGMESVNFSRDILESASERSVVLPMDGVRWCDWGRPRRVLETLAGLGKAPSFPPALAAD